MVSMPSQSQQASLAQLYTSAQANKPQQTPAQTQAVAANPIEPARETMRVEAGEPRRDGDERLGSRINAYA